MGVRMRRLCRRNERMGVWRNGCIEEWVYGGMGVWRNGCMEEWVYGGMGVWGNGECIVSAQPVIDAE